MFPHYCLYISLKIVDIQYPLILIEEGVECILNSFVQSTVIFKELVIHLRI